MKNMTIEKLLEKLSYFNNEEKEKVISAYNFANIVHNGQYRKSGELYITHPLSVAYILAYFKVDSDTIAATLLHDVIEDSNFTKEDIEELLNHDIAVLVDGVTKIKREYFNTKEEQNNANTRKNIIGIKIDPRIIIIKLADRLHNMLTMEYQKEIKQVENSYETVEIFSPLAYHTGMLEIKKVLEELSLPYIDKKTYNEILKQKDLINDNNKINLKNIFSSIKERLKQENINNEIYLQVKNIYEIYIKLNKGANIKELHDLFSIQIIVDDIKRCYETASIIKDIYPYASNDFNDYITNPKGNLYQGIHLETAINNNYFKFKIRTREMDKVDTFGIASYWELYQDKALEQMKIDLNQKCDIYKRIIDIDTNCDSDKEFVKSVRKLLIN